MKLAVVYDAADAIAPAQQACYFAAGKDLRAVFAGVEHIGRGEAKRVDGTVRDLHRAQQRRVDGGLPAQALPSARAAWPLCQPADRRR